VGASPWNTQASAGRGSLTQRRAINSSNPARDNPRIIGTGRQMKAVKQRPDIWKEQMSGRCSVAQRMSRKNPNVPTLALRSGRIFPPPTHTVKQLSQASCDSAGR